MFLPVKVLSRVFRGKFLAMLREAYDRGELRCLGRLETLYRPAALRGWLTLLYQAEWVVYAKPPFGGPEQVLKYLARYTHRVASSNDRLVSLENGQVKFRWKDYRRGSRWGTIQLDACEFLRRFLQHVLPKGFVRIRHFGLLANRHRTERIQRCRELLRGMSQVSAGEVPTCQAEPSDTPPCCPHCGLGTIAVIDQIPRPRWHQLLAHLLGCDSS